MNPVMRNYYYVALTASVIVGGCSFITKPQDTVFAATSVAEYKGNGFSFSYPATWKKQVVGETVALLTPEPINQICFKITPTGETDFTTFFLHYQRYAPQALGFEPTFNGSPEPTVYGAWRGATLTGYGSPGGVAYVASATAIRANNQVYLLQMAAPSARSWEAYELRKTLANSLTFARLPQESHGTSAPCLNCFSMWSDTMNRITKQTTSMMK
jgi:hypothetical protein